MPKKFSEEDFEDSVEDIFRELEEATGSLVSSIRNAAENPIEGNDAICRGYAYQIIARRCHVSAKQIGCVDCCVCE